jgi:hypothetical protein
MATVNNATGLYATLGYNFNDPNGDVQTLSANAQAHMSSMPAFIQTWQAQDIINSSVGGYFQNPVSTDVNTIITVASQMFVLANTAANSNTFSVNVNSLIIMANTLTIDATAFLAHTNRISGVTAYNGDNSVPYYENAMSLGKTALYITNQTDGIINTSPILGSFTSLFIGPQISANAAILSNDLIILTNGLSGNTLSNAQVTQIVTDLTVIDTLLTTRQSADYTYFTNLKNFVNNYNTVKQFSNLGETQTYLMNNFIGTPKLVTRINS